MESRVRTVLLGNSFASGAQLPALRWAGGAEVVGVAGRDLAKARATASEWGIERATDRWEELLELEPDLVLVTTPVDLHAPMVRAALETRAAILCEKPFAMDAREALDLAERARGRAAWIDHQLRWNPYRREMRRLVREGYVGDLWHARIEWHAGGTRHLERPFSWWFRSDRGGGVLGAAGSHAIDGVLWMLGPIEAVRARLCTFVPERADSAGAMQRVTADEHAALWLRLASGAEVSLTVTVALPGASTWCVELVGSEGTLLLDWEERLLGARHGEELRPLPCSGRIPTAEELGMPPRGPFARLLPSYLRDLVRAVGEGRTELPEAATFDDGVACMRVLDAARRSSREGEWIPCR